MSCVCHLWKKGQRCRVCIGKYDCVGGNFFDKRTCSVRTTPLVRATEQQHILSIFVYVISLFLDIKKRR